MVELNGKAFSDCKSPKRIKLTSSAYERVSNREALGLTKHDLRWVFVTKPEKLW